MKKQDKYDADGAHVVKEYLIYGFCASSVFRGLHTGRQIDVRLSHNQQNKNYHLLSVLADGKGRMALRFNELRLPKATSNDDSPRGSTTCRDVKFSQCWLKDVIVDDDHIEFADDHVDAVFETPAMLKGHTAAFCAIVHKKRRGFITFFYEPSLVETEPSSEVDPKFLREDWQPTLNELIKEGFRDVRFRENDTVCEDVLQIKSKLRSKLSRTYSHIIVMFTRLSKLDKLLETCIKNVYGLLKHNYYRVIAENGKTRKVVEAKDLKVDDGWCINQCYVDATSASSLDPFTYLDDATINYFFEFIYEYIMTKEQKQRCPVFNTFFMRKIAQYTDAQDAYSNTSRWTKRYNCPLVKCDYIFVPLNMQGIHWSLVVIANPNNAIKTPSETSTDKAVMLYLDSLGHSKLPMDTDVLLRSYLHSEFASRCGELKEQGYQFHKDNTAWLSVHGTIDVPLQQNNHDCGVYVIEYINYLMMNQHCLEHLVVTASKIKLEKEANGGISETENAIAMGAPKLWFTQEQIDIRRVNMREMLDFMRENPRWPQDDKAIMFLKSKMTQQA